MKVDLPELAAMTVPHSPSLPGTPGATHASKLRPSDIAAALSGIVDQSAYMLFMLNYCGATDDDTPLVEALVAATPGASEQQRAPLMARIAIREKIRGADCSACEGLGVTASGECSSCRGRGIATRVTAGQRARALGLSLRQWNRSYAGLHTKMLRVLNQWDMSARQQVMEKLG